ncbi:IS21 family transposase [Gracilibacillus salinarum]|uniref:IS21 family transposase n=1 Tax=Gracilibacillus salinarum TaxID=2932255 RepID=A0ABY4GND7_9BACI|nr:IS21 family transposase [Gracilibacillus salinarum]UOQ85764.1 IS21 family transposase [Gracilibacillus salinarum]
MDKWKMYMEIQQLIKQGFSKTKVAEKLGVSRSTVYRNLEKSPSEMAGWVESLKTRSKKLEPYKELILSWLREHSDMSAAQVHDWLQEKHEDLKIGESTVRSFVRELREEYQIEKVTSPRDYEAIPDLPMGEQIQVDFGHTKQKTHDNRDEKLNFIAFVLANSRYKYKEWLDRPFTTQDVIRAHENAFKWFGGIPRELVYDQDSLIVVSENGGDLILTKEFQQYKETRKLNLYVCRKADPESKGKIENVVGFIKHNFAKHRVFHNIDSWNEQGWRWLNRTGNYKVHNTTKKRPVEVFSLEKQHLRPITKDIDLINNYEHSITRSVHKNNTIRYLSNRYSLPLGTFNKFENVCIKETEDKELIIYISQTGEIIAKHKIPEGKGQLVKDRKHSRDRTKGVGAFIDTVTNQFTDKELANHYLETLREKYPRYIKDQLQIILRETKENNENILSAALSECIKRNLYSATDFSDIVSYLKRQRRVDDTTTDNDQMVAPLNKTSGWVMETEAQKRKVDTYTDILEGDAV